MLGGLEVSEISFYDVFSSSDDFRLNSEFYLKEFLAAENYFNSVRTVQLNEVAKIGDGDHSKFPDDQIEEVRYLQARDITNNFLEISSNAFVSKDYFTKNQRSAITGEAILLSIMGTVGDITITPRDFESCMCNRALAIVRDIKGVSPQFLFSYLTTKHAFNNIERQKNGGVQQRINLDVLGKIRIPLLSDSFQNKIEQTVILAQDTRKKTKSTYSQAEILLLETLCLANFSPSTEAVNIKSFKESFATSGRLDAESYQSKYDQLRDVFEVYSGGVTTIGTLAGQIANGAEVREYQEEGVAYLRVGDLKNLTIDAASVVRIDPASAETGLEKIDLQVGDVLVSRSGSLAVTAVVEPEWADALISSHLIRLRITDKRIDPYYLALFLCALPGKMQIQQRSNGGVQPEINQPALKSILVPIPPQSDQQEIRRLILSARKLRDSSNNLLDVAKRAVEIAIEQDEQAALNFIARESNNVF